MKEAFNIGVDYAPDDPEIVLKRPFRVLNAWPDLPEFRATMLAYFEACTTLARSVHRAFTRDLGAALGFLRRQARQAADDAQAAALSDDAARRHRRRRTYGLRQHHLARDGRCQRPRGRTRAGEWVAAPPMPGAFVVNIGDCLMRWTNDVYVSNPHRVINASGRERYSIAFFFDPNPDAFVEAIPSCIASGEAAKYPPILAADYLQSRFEATYLKK